MSLSLLKKLFDLRAKALLIILHMNYDVSVGMQQRIIIPNKQGQKLVGVFHDTGSEKLAVLCHGFRSSKVCKLFWFQNLLVW